MRDRSTVEMISNLDGNDVVLKKLRAIRREISFGIYDTVQVVSVSNAFDVLLNLINSKPHRRATKEALYSQFDVSKSIIGNLVLNRHSPKMENFFPIVDRMIFEFEREMGLGSISTDALQGYPTNWLATDRASEKIADLSELLAELVQTFKFSNGLTPSVLGVIQKAQLIAVLETALAQLKGPLIEGGLFRKLHMWLVEIAKKSAKRGVDTASGKLAEAAAETIANLVKALLS